MSVDRLCRVFSSALQVPLETDFESLRVNSIREWDSIGQVELVVALEEAFEVELSPEDVFDLDSFSKAREILSRHGVQFSV